MINIEYTMTPQETVNTTMDFLTNRPFLSSMFLFMRISCLLFCIVFALSVFTTKSARPQDLATIVFAIAWLLYYKSINRWVIKKSLANRKFYNMGYKFKIDEKSIFCRLHSDNIINIEWKKIKHILKNKDGYIIPLTGMGNAGRFLWLPTRGFTDNSIEQDFINLTSKFKLKIKNI